MVIFLSDTDRGVAPEVNRRQCISPTPPKIQVVHEQKFKDSLGSEFQIR